MIIWIRPYQNVTDPEHWKKEFRRNFLERFPAKNLSKNIIVLVSFSISLGGRSDLNFV
jgi:hypothetical protein